MVLGPQASDPAQGQEGMVTPQSASSKLLNVAAGSLSMLESLLLLGACRPLKVSTS